MDVVLEIERGGGAQVVNFGMGEEDVRRVCRLFGMSFWADMGMIAHTMRTVVIGRDGRVVAKLEGNEFTPRQLGDLIASVIGRGRRTALHSSTKEKE